MRFWVFLPNNNYFIFFFFFVHVMIIIILLLFIDILKEKGTKQLSIYHEYRYILAVPIAWHKKYEAKLETGTYWFYRFYYGIGSLKKNTFVLVLVLLLLLLLFKNNLLQIFFHVFSVKFCRTIGTETRA